MLWLLFSPPDGRGNYLLYDVHLFLSLIHRIIQGINYLPQNSKVNELPI